MDKQDELAAVIMAAWDDAGEVPFPLYEREASHIAAAVRSYLGSDEVVERVAAAIVKQDDGCDWSEMSDRAREWERGVARAALSAAGGGHAER